MFTSLQIDAELARLRHAVRETKRPRNRNAPAWWRGEHVERLTARIRELEASRRAYREEGQ